MLASEVVAREGAEYGAAPTGLSLTRDLAQRLADTRFGDLPDSTRHAAVRGIVDWYGCVLAGVSHPASRIVASALQAAGGRGDVPAIGRQGRWAPGDAALLMGQAGHVLDFDDTHMGGVILHAASPILSALFALAASESMAGRPVSGERLIAAYVAGVEVGVRAGQAAPRHHNGGWHLTGTLGAIAAATASAHLLGLDARRMTHAIGIGASQAAGLQQHRGTMTKSFHAGRAAQSGILAARLAEAGYDASPESLEGRKGFCRIFSAEVDLDQLSRPVGAPWEIENNGFKPYPCGIVLHPAIDAMRELSLRLRGRMPEQVRLEVAPAAIRITGVADPDSGLKAKFSIGHVAALALSTGRVDLLSFTDDAVAGSLKPALAEKIAIVADESLGTDAARASARLSDGSLETVEILSARGTVNNPMTDRDLEEKFLANAKAGGREADAAALLPKLWSTATRSDVATLVI